LQTVLRWILTKKRPEDRMKIFREWARVNLAVKLGRKPSEEEFDADLDLWCKKQFNSAVEVLFLSDFIKDFVPRFSAQNRIDRAKKAAAKRWTKKSEKDF
jgi:hypothetical protein